MNAVKSIKAAEYLKDAKFQITHLTERGEIYDICHLIEEQAKKDGVEVEGVLDYLDDLQEKAEADFTPAVGDGVSICYPSDSYPCVVTKVTAKYIYFKQCRHEGIEPKSKCNGFPVFNHRFTNEELVGREYGEERRAFRGKDGRYKDGGIPIGKFGARYYRNYAE